MTERGRPSLRRISFVKRADMGDSGHPQVMTQVIEVVRKCQLAFILLRFFQIPRIPDSRGADASALLTSPAQLVVYTAKKKGN